MPLFMDRHYSKDTSWSEIEHAHASDLALQQKYGVQFFTYWFDEGRQTTFCLVSAPSAEVISKIHSEAHGAIPNDVVEVDQATVLSFMGRVADIPAGQSPDGRVVDRAFRTIMFTDIVGYTSLTLRTGDENAMRVLRRHNEIVRDALRQFGGTEVKHTGDGVMASFADAHRALQAAVKIQDEVESTGTADGDDRLRLRIGISAGEPIQEGADLFGVSVNLASRLCDAAGPGDVYLAQEFIEALETRSVDIESLGLLALKGFDQPVRVSRVAR